ncbi:MAG: putative porin, partial [Prosthecobacter sp.]|nr:putative porin [Prosthecobacter sp.]
NRGANPGIGQIGAYEGGDTAFMFKTEFGKAKFEKKYDWSTWIDYRYVESDAMPDAFTDNDFGGGTNFQGFTIGAHVALSPSVKLGARWMSTTQIAGPPLKMDIFMIDISAKY